LPPKQRDTAEDEETGFRKKSFQYLASNDWLGVRSKDWRKSIGDRGKAAAARAGIKLPGVIGTIPDPTRGIRRLQSRLRFRFIGKRGGERNRK